MHRSFTFLRTGSFVLILALLFGACNDSITGEDPDEDDDDDGDPVFVLSDIDGSWQQEDEERRYLDIQSGESDDGTFYEAFFQDDEEEFGEADCYAVVRNEVIDTNSGEFTIRVFEEGEDPEDVQVTFEVQSDADGNPERVRMTREDSSFDAWFEPAELTVDDFEPRCAEEDDDDGDNGEEAVTDLSEIDGSWQQTDEERRYFDVVSDEGDMGWFYEAFFQDDEEEFDETDCYAVSSFEVVDQENDTLIVMDEDEEEIEVAFFVERDEEDEPTSLRFVQEDDDVEATFEPSDVRLDDFEPECE